MSGSDALLWTIERDPVLRSTVVVVCVLDRSPDVDRIRGRVAGASTQFPRLHQRVETSPMQPPRWSDVDVDLDQHIQRVALPRPGSMRQLLDLAGTMAGEAFDPARPLWRALVVDGLEHGRSALVIKVHHAVTDGVGGIGLLPLLTDSPAARQRGTRPPGRSSPSSPRAALQVVSTVGSAVGGAITHPMSALRTAPRLGRSAVKLLAPAAHPCSPLLTGRGIDRHLTTIDLPRRDLERTARATGATVNDVFLAAVIGGVARYHTRHGVQVEQLRVTMPISTRQDRDATGGNRFVPVRFVAPAAISDPVQRIHALGQIVRRWRGEPALGLSSVIAEALERLPGDATTKLFGSMLKGVDVVATNVPGLTRRASIGGAEITTMFGFAPTAGAALNVALVSHVDRCCIGITVDSAAVPDPADLTTSLQEAFDEVVAIGRRRPSAHRARSAS
jgi:WS/DGAT/MGAT family acyltransferase